MKRKLKDIKSVLYKYASTNVLFLSFIILSILMSFILRVITIGSPLYIKALFGDLLVLIIIGSFGYLFKPSKQFTYFFSLIIFFSILCVGNTIYYEFYQSFLSINLIATASMVSDVKAAAFDKVYFYQFLYLIVPIVFYIIHKQLNKRKYYFEVEKIENGKKRFIYSIAGSFIILIALLVTASGSDFSKFQKLWNREYVVSKYGLYFYHVNDLVQSIEPKLTSLYGYDEEATNFRNYYACKWEKKDSSNEWTDYFKGKNLLVIHAESIQNFLINLKINGEYVTPNINKLASEGMYFNKFYPQISVGTSSDTEFTFNTGLMPSSSGTVFVNYYDRKYYSIPKYFNELGYYTFSSHANNADYWNRKIMHNTLGYQDFYAKDSFIVPTDTDDKDFIGLGLSDESFFEQLIPILSNIKSSHTNYYGTIITLSNHAPFNDIDKYLDFDVSMNYTYINDNGIKETINVPYLEGTPMGDYIKSAHYADYALGKFIDNLKKNNLLENTVIMLYGDHEARLAKKEFIRLYNYDPIIDGIKPSDSEDYISMDNYNYDLLKNTPFIIWNNDEKYETVINKTMGMYDVLPTIANMFGFKEKYALGNDIFSNNESIVVFPNGNVLTDKVYYSSLNDEYIAFENTLITSDYIDKIKDYSNKILSVSNGIVVYNLILNEESKIGECINEKEK